MPELPHSLFEDYWDRFTREQLATLPVSERKMYEKQFRRGHRELVVDNLIRRELRVGDPRNAIEVTALRRRYAKDDS